MKKIFLILPIFLILILSAFLFIYILQKKDPNKPPSALLNENVPKFTTNSLFDKNTLINTDSIKEKITIINFFASWCAPCKIEHKLFFEIKKKHPELLLIGINYKDNRKEALEYLEKDGNPYDYVGLDEKGLIGLEFGVFGLPETFLINKSGKIIYKYLGPLNKKVIKNEIYSIIK